MSRLSVTQLCLGIGLGVVTAVCATFLVEKDVLAAIFGFLVAIAVADLREVKQHVIVGFATGAGIGLVLRATGRSHVGESVLPTGPSRTIAHLVATTIVFGLLCASFGFITGKVKERYDRGRGPFF